MKPDCACSPEVVLALVRARDRAALDRVTRCYGRRLFAVGRRACADPESAKDAVQDALVAAGRHLGDFRGTGSVEGWLVRMVENACRTRRRGRKNDPAWNAAFDETRAPAGDASPEEGAARMELVDALEAALLVLSPTDRAVVLLTELDGWSGPQVARALDLTPEAVRARRMRARRRLREALGAAGVHGSA